ncbi:hypothetical protein HA1_08552 [Clostridium perfringens F262]|jgi:hypothetical protein|uniref:Uncharacterized protein n=1 Tax=Clostridium perfringens F262 TaxID=883064 RepID=A0AAV3FCN6_CLOPF|nr:Not available [Clostridium perfringens]EIA17034.1 hypothetical protein HA1_08552 [Clostridium perfringens F262]DAM84964.1 MAG TPA: hypothetical protein [Caudoviricetes sp.]
MRKVNTGCLVILIVLIVIWSIIYYVVYKILGWLVLC